MTPIIDAVKADALGFNDDGQTNLTAKARTWPVARAGRRLPRLRGRQLIVVWTDQPAHTLDASVVPADLASRVPADFSALTDVWE